MKSIKRFLLGFIAIYIVIGVAINMRYGPPGFSSEFLSTYRAEADRYVETMKSDAFKLWQENPGMHPPDNALQQRIDFVERFRANPDFRAESERRDTYDTVSDWFNVIMLTVLIVVLARGPIARFVTGLAAAERERIETIERKRSAVARRKSEAERKLEQIDNERAKADAHAAARIAEETRLNDAATEDALRQVREEAEDRRRHEELLARRRLKAILADEAIAILEARYRMDRSAEQDDALVSQFLQDLGERT